tara:strand:- start:1397 stop:3820 length:2424 start_codon:yes stop_codon:yes gene_type:complete
MIRRTRKLGITIVLAIAVLLTGYSASAESIDEETMAFLKRRAPAVVEAIKLQGREGGEDLGEARERAIEVREMFLEEKEEKGEEWAEVLLGLEDVEAEIEVLLWRFKEDKIGEDKGEVALLRLLKKQIALLNKVDRMEIKRLQEETDEMEEELQWRIENPEVALRERFEETLRDFGLSDEDVEEEEMEGDEKVGPLYTPAPEDRAGQKDELHGITFDFGKGIRPTLEHYCFDCHDSASAKGDIDLESALAQTPMVRNRLLWENVAERVKMGDMPPKKKAQPSDADRLKLRAWLAAEIGGFNYSTVRNPGYVPARRLTREEYNRTIRDLVGLDLRPADDFPMDFSGTSGFSNSANTLFLQTAHLDRYFTAAEGVIDEVRADGNAWRNLAGKPGVASETIARFMRRAYRRLPTEAEIKEVTQHYEASLAKRRSQPDALADAFKTILVSPNFLLRVEQSSNIAKDQAIGDFDLATRLSYFLWASTPDEELLAAAGELSDFEKRQDQVKRMLADPRSLSLGEIFAAEWLSTDDVGPRIRKDPIDNPWCTETLMTAMRAETAHFFHSLVRDNAPVSRLIDSDYTFLNAELAKFYRIGGVEGTAMRKVDLETTQRGGVFGHASVLATTSFPDRTSPVVRGKWILDTLLGTPPPPPPPDVPEIDVEGRGSRAATTLRKKLEAHRDSPRCAGCHSQIDPLGFALESYAEFGQWRGGVDDRGTLPSGAKFRGPEGLKLALIDERIDDLGSQAIRKMLAYALGRQLEFYDEATVKEIAAKLKPTGYRFGDLVFAITESYPFTMKRLPSVSTRKSDEE